MRGVTSNEPSPGDGRSMQAIYEEATYRSRSSYSSARQHVPSGVSRQTLAYPPYPFFASKAEGQSIWDVDGQRYIDFVNNYTSLIHGHAHPKLVRAATDALANGGALGAPVAAEQTFARRLIDRFPVMEQLRFTLSGSEATMFAIRAARAFTGRPRVLKFEGGFHGGHDEVQQSIFSPPLDKGAFSTGMPNSLGLMPVPTIVAVYNDVESVRAAFEQYGDEIAAVIVEPFLGNAGLVTADPGFLSTLAVIAHDYGALLVLDEIQSMRLSYGGAQELHGVTPDIVALGKIMGGGMPLAAVGAGREIMTQFDGFTPDVPQTGTFTAFDVALATGDAAMAEFDRHQIDRLGHLGTQIREGIRAVFGDLAVPVTVNGWGSMFNVTLAEGPVTTYRSWRTAPHELWVATRLGLLSRGIYITARGTGCLSTPMTIGDIDQFLAKLADSAREALNR